MRIGKLNTSKCSGKLQKIGVLYTHPLLPPRSLGPCYMQGPQKKIFKRRTIFKKNWAGRNLIGAAGNQRSPAVRGVGP
jgi:hypothetical protein